LLPINLIMVLSEKRKGKIGNSKVRWFPARIIGEKQDKHEDSSESGEDTRLISAREAEKHERRSYNGYYQIDGKGWAKAT
jgi:uncharacterized DUF497 family protein